MRHLCAWCQADIRTIPAAKHAEAATSHGICETCLGELERRQGTQLFALVEELPHAALAVDADLRIRAVNQRACDLFQDEWASLLGHRLGEILGCGHGPEVGWEHPICPGCQLHGFVLHTLHTGKSGVTTMPGPDARSLQVPASRAHRATSLRVGDMVALRLDPLQIPAGSPFH